MPNITITQLPAAGPITGTESVPIVQNGQTLRTTTAALAGSPVQTQTFLTLNQEPTLNNSRALAGGAGIGLVDGGAQSTLQVTLNGASGSLEAASTGVIVKTGASTVTSRSIAVSGTGLAITDGDGVSGNPTVALDGLIAAMAQVGGTGLLAFQNGTTAGGVEIFGTANEIDVANGNGQGGNPTISITSNPVIPGTGAMKIPSGTTAQQPVGSDGDIRYNLDTGFFEGFAAGSWSPFSSGGGVTSFSAGSTGLTPISASIGAVTLGGTLNVDSGGTGATSLTGYLVGNGTSAFTAVATIPNAGLTNDSVTYNGVTVALGSSGTITAANPNALTIGTGLTGGSYDGSGAVTIAIDSTVATLTGTQTLTNKTISGTNNTLTDIGNGSLTNSAITINGSSVSLGGSVTVTATASNALTIGTGLAGGSYDGSSAITIAIDSTVATLTGSQTLTNKSMSGSSNTFTDIPNGALTNSGVTFNGSTVALGGSATITANTTNALTIGTGLSGTSFNGGAAVTIAIDSTVATLTGTQTFTNKSISGSANTLTDIPNNALTNSSLTIGSTVISLGGTSLTLGGLTSVAVTQDPTSALELTTKQYVDTLVASGIHFHQPVRVESTIPLTATYNNGTAGVGATLTNAGTQVALVLDGVTVAVNDRVLIYLQTNQTQNGIYVVTDVGSGSTNWVLTRAADADTYVINSANGLSEGSTVFVQQGTLAAGDTYTCNTSGVITFGTTNITFVQVSSAQVYSAGTGLTLTSTTFSITNTGVANGSYGTASSVPTLAINAQGQITTASNTSIAIDGNQITSGTVGSAYISGSYTGITGVGVLTAGTWNATAISDTYLSTISTAGKVSNSATTATSADTANAIVARDASGNFSAGTITASLTGTASSATSATTATNIAGGTAGAIPYNTGAGATSFLSLGTNGYVLAAGATAPQYVDQSTLSVGSATNATNATNTAVTANSTNATNYLTFVSATSGNLPQLVNSSITCNPSTGQITGGIAGGAF